jgi:hypothetical protein
VSNLEVWLHVHMRACMYACTRVTRQKSLIPSVYDICLEFHSVMFL